MTAREWLDANPHEYTRKGVANAMEAFAAAKVEEFAEGLAEALDELYGEASENGVPIDTRKRVVAALAAYHEAVGK